MGQKVNLYLTRHGQTYFNIYNRLQGWSDTPLTPAGADMADQLGKGLQGQHFDQIMSSDSGRAIKTAQLIQAAAQLENIPHRYDERLREMFFGELDGEYFRVAWELMAKAQGKTMDAVLTEPILQQLHYVQGAHNPDAELVGDFEERLMSCLDDLVYEAQKHHDTDILIVTHGCAISQILVAVQPDLDLLTVPRNASLSKIVVEDGVYTLEYYDNVDAIEKGQVLER